MKLWWRKWHLVAMCASILVIGLSGALASTFTDGPAKAQNPATALAEGLQIEPGGWHGNDECGCIASTLRFQLGSIEGLRDIQGGQLDPGGGRFNALDIAAGNAQQPGRLGIGADNTGTIVYHARQPSPSPPILLATMTPDGTTFHAPVTFEGPAYGLPIVTAAQVRQMVRRGVRRHLRKMRDARVRD